MLLLSEQKLHMVNEPFEWAAAVCVLEGWACLRPDSVLHVANRSFFAEVQEVWLDSQGMPNTAVNLRARPGNLRDSGVAQFAENTLLCTTSGSTAISKHDVGIIRLHCQLVVTHESYD